MWIRRTVLFFAAILILLSELVTSWIRIQELLIMRSMRIRIRNTAFITHPFDLFEIPFQQVWDPFQQVWDPFSTGLRYPFNRVEIPFQPG